MISYLSFCGILASFWIIAGVIFAAKRYPNYDHNKQFLSELGAKGSPTESFSPRINNYPLGVLFCLSGLGVMLLPDNNIWLVFAGAMIVVHGIGTWVAGYFPMDLDAYTTTPSLEGKVHYWAGTVMMISLLCAPIAVTLSPTSEKITLMFKAFSSLFLFLTCFFTYKLAKAYERKLNPGLYQRISYGFQLVWLSTFSFILL